MSLKEIIKLMEEAIHAEIDTQGFYEEASKCTKRPEAKKMFKKHLKEIGDAGLLKIIRREIENEEFKIVGREIKSCGRASQYHDPEECKLCKKHGE